MTHKLLPFVLACVLFVGCKTEKKAPAATSLYETQLFKDVQLAAIYPDSKTFVDLVPNDSYTVLEQRYLASKDQEGFSLANTM